MVSEPFARTSRREQLQRSFRRRVRASGRYLRLVVAKFWLPFTTIWVLLLCGTLLFHSTYMESLHRKPDLTESLFATYSLFSLESVYPLPASWALRVMYFVYPLAGLLVVADTLVRVTLLLFSRQENQKEWTKVLASTYRDHIILCGLGHVGYRILERLLQWNLDVVVIEKNDGSQFLQRVQQLKVPVLLMDARQEESLEAAGLHHARTLVIATNDDLANVEIALDARRLNPGIRVVLRMFDEQIANKLRDAFNLEVAFSGGGGGSAGGGLGAGPGHPGQLHAGRARAVYRQDCRRFRRRANRPDRRRDRSRAPGHGPIPQVRRLSQPLWPRPHRAAKSRRHPGHPRRAGHPTQARALGQSEALAKQQAVPAIVSTQIAAREVRGLQALGALGLVWDRICCSCARPRLPLK